ncbi:hypothetical protein Cgig2_026418 [Carnegiea gigantea]|uniref:Uncharacterized protein n=1 Tax=Carnegiea gigantea TaxID=171969 RepID=A0A9Q1JFW5_9CARY|nr:hypothetical protein Cgig2_026418 [Carnegiea gigantea]
MLCTKPKRSQISTKRKTDQGSESSTLRKVLKDQKAHRGQKEEGDSRLSIARLVLLLLIPFYRLYHLSHQLRNRPQLVVLPYIIMEVAGRPLLFRGWCPKGILDWLIFVLVRDVSPARLSMDKEKVVLPMLHFSISSQCRIYLKDHEIITRRQQILFLEGRPLQGGYDLLIREVGAPGNTDPSATISRAGCIWEWLLFLRTDLPGVLGPSHGEELVDAPSENELLDIPPEEELDDTSSKEGLILLDTSVIRVSYSDFPGVRNLSLNTKDTRSRRVLAARPPGSAGLKDRHLIGNLFRFPTLGPAHSLGTSPLDEQEEDMMVHSVNTINNTQRKYKGVPGEDEDSKEEAEDEDENTNRSFEDTKERVEGAIVSLKV